MIINETTSLTGNVTIPELNGEGVATGNVITVMYLASNLDANTMNVNINVNTVNKPLVLANAAEVKAQYDEFQAKVESRATELGYVIF